MKVGKLTLTKTQEREIESGWKLRNKMLVGLGLPKETKLQYTEWLYGLGKKEKKYSTKEKENTRRTGLPISHQNRLDKKPNSLASWVTGPVSSKPSPTYTGEKMIGIAQTHKSNAVPVFSENEIQEIGRMRR